MVDIGFDKPPLLVWGGVTGDIARIGPDGVVVVVGPFGKVVCKFEARHVGGGVFKVDHDELFVLVCRLEEGGFFVVRTDAEDVAVLRLRGDTQ